MSRIRDLICFAIAFAIAFTVVFQFKHHLWTTSADNSESLHHVESKRQLAIRIDRNWTTFQMPNNIDSVKILSNAVVDSASVEPVEAKADSNVDHRYAIEYELLDGNDKSIRHGTYHFRSKPTKKRDSKSGEVVDSLQLAKSDGLVTQTKILETKLDNDLKNARLIRLRVGEVDDSVAEVLTRISCKTMRKGYDRFGAWESIPESHKERLAMQSVYEHHLLDDVSRQGLLKWRWQRATPIGQFERRLLYIFGDRDSKEVSGEATLPGTTIQPGWKMVLPIGNVASTIRVEATSADSSSSETGVLYYRFDDPVSSTRKAGSLELKQNADSSSCFAEIKGVVGLLELEVDRNSALRIFQCDPTAQQSNFAEVEVEPRHLPVYVADQRPVVFSVSHFDESTTPLKVSFRFTEESFLDPSATNTNMTRPKRVRWKYLAGDGQVLDHGEENFFPEVSVHERFPNDLSNVAVTDPIDRWFSVPPEAAKVEFWSEESHALVSAYARPADLPSRTRVPEDYSDKTRLESPHRRWFLLRPENFQQYLKENRVLHLKVQSRLPELENENDLDDQDSIANLTWRRFEPKGDWLAARILVPAIDPLKLQTEKPDSVWLWHELTSGQPIPWSTLQRTAAYNNAQITFVSQRRAGTIEIWNDEKLVITKAFSTKRGTFEVVLPEDHGMLHVKATEDVRVFISGLNMDTPNPWYRRTATRVEPTPTVFEYEKKTWDDEFLTLTLFRHDTENSQAGISVNIVPRATESQAKQPRQSWTIKSRSFDVSPMPVANSILMDRSGRLDSGSRCFMKLGSDLPPGTYDIEVQRDDRNSGYLLLYQTIPEKKMVRHIGIHDNRDQN